MHKILFQPVEPGDFRHIRRVEFRDGTRDGRVTQARGSDFEYREIIELAYPVGQEWKVARVFYKLADRVKEHHNAIVA